MTERQKETFLFLSCVLKMSRLSHPARHPAPCVSNRTTCKVAIRSIRFTHKHRQERGSIERLAGRNGVNS